MARRTKATRCSASVSYTHLDVYKRQAVLVIAGLVFGGFMLLKNILPAAGEKTEEPKTPDEMLCYYMAEIEQDKYEEMYDLSLIHIYYNI